MELSHLNDEGNARMVNVGEKEITERIAVAEGFVRMKPETLQMIKDGTVKKGDVLSVATVAGINAAKHTWEIVPMCHNIVLNGCEIRYEYKGDDVVRILARVSATGKTGVEMEALCAVSAVALTIYDMVKAVDKGMIIDGIKLIEKEGGKSGIYRRV